MKSLILLLIYAFSSTTWGDEQTVVLPLKAIPSDLRLDRLIQVDQIRVARLLSGNLFEVGENLQLEGKLAKNSYWEKGGKKLYIELGEATFSDGSPMNVDSVIHSLSDCIKSGPKNTTSAFSKIEGYRDFILGKSKRLKGLLKEGKNKMSLQTTHFAPLMKENLSAVSCSIIKPLKKGSNDLLSGAIGTGPYTIEKKTPKMLVLRKRFGRGPSRVKFISTNHYGNFDKLKSKVDLILVDSNIGDKKGFNKHKNSRLAYWQLSFNNENEPFNNLNLRKALSLGLDYKFLAERMGHETANLQEGLFPLGMRGFRPRREKPGNLEKANQILAQMGYRKEKPLKFSILLSKRKGVENSSRIWKKAFKGLSSIEISVELVEHRELIKRRREGKFDLLFHGKDTGSHDPHILLASYLSNSHFNTPRIKNRMCDRLIEKSLEIYDRGQRWDSYKKAENCLLNAYFIIPLATLNSGYALVKRPWKIARKNQYLLKPYDVDKWVKERP
ncbi:MAG: ABC transporter substrate-binding protein [Bacteriovoracales bacterium]|nr:ABC transporter substrate-binding protein [Bacteriovoracales bacterium]